MNESAQNFKTSNHLISIELPEKEKLIADIRNIEDSWTGRMDAQIANTFFHESCKLIINSIVLFEQGYFDCAYYSLRQSLEVSTTIIYLTDSLPHDKNEKLNQWKSQSKFPMYKQMMDLLENNETIFSDIKDRLSEYFKGIELVKKKLNKVVHKQGFNTFYVSRSSPMSKRNNSVFIDNFQYYVKKCIGSIAFFRLAIDPFPVLLMDEEIYRRTGDTMTLAYSDEFVDEYMGREYVELYKKTSLFENHYDSIIQEERKNDFVLDVVKHNYIKRDKINAAIIQSHLMSEADVIAVTLISIDKNISRVYDDNIFNMYYTDLQTIRTKNCWSSEEFRQFEINKKQFNLTYDEAFVSWVNINNRFYFMEHNSIFDDNTILLIKEAEMTWNDKLAPKNR